MALAKTPSRRKTIVAQSTSTLVANKSLCIEQSNDGWRITIEPRIMRLTVIQEERLFALFGPLPLPMMIGSIDVMH